MQNARKLNLSGTQRLHFGRLNLAEHSWRHWSANIPEGVELKEILQEDFWTHYHKQIRPMDIVTAMREDGAWEAWLRVMFVSPAGVKMEIMFSKEYDTIDEQEAATLSDIYDVKWGGPSAKFRVIRLSDNTVIKDGFHPKSEAFAYIKNLRA